MTLVTALAGRGILADPPVVDPITGGAGWLGAGLLGLVLAWLLLKHLPEKDRYVRDLIERHDKLMGEVNTQALCAQREQRDTHIRSLDSMTTTAREEVRMIRAALSENTAAVLDTRRVLEDLREALMEKSRKT